MCNEKYYVVGTKCAYEAKLIPLIIAGSFIVLSNGNINFELE